MRTESKWLLSVATAVTAVYCLLVFPFSYFRHDDWLILGNSIRYFGVDWKTAFDPTLYYLDKEVIWFFRPLFKAITWLFYQLFELNYFAWLVSLMLLAGLGVFWMLLSLKRVVGSWSWAVFCTLIFLCSFHLHFGSLFWAGEGLMNSPQLCLLALSTLCFLKALDQKKSSLVLYLVSFVSWVVALGFKESSVLHCGFLLFVSQYEGGKFSFSRKKILLSSPFVVAGVAFFIWRIWFVPVNPYYVPKWESQYLLRPALLLLGAYTVPILSFLLAMFLMKKLRWSHLSRGGVQSSLFWGVFLLAIIPYLGHTFFSPGWFLVPTYYLLFALALLGVRMTRKVSLSAMQSSSFALVFVSLLVVGGKLVKEKWWNWKPAQQEIVALVQGVPAHSAKELRIYDCPSSGHPGLTADRILGFKEGLYQLWAIHHPEPIDVKIFPCHDQKMRDRFAHSEDRIVLRWEFPKLDWINEESFVQKQRSIAQLPRQDRSRAEVPQIQPSALPSH